MIMWHHQRLSQLAALVLLMSSRIVGISSGRLPGYMRDEAFIGYSEAYLDGYSELLVFSTRYGDIKVKFFGQASPKTVRYLKSLVAKGMFDGCAFYRAEAPGETYDEGHEDPRKGYALLQGGLYSCGKQQVNLLPVETLVPNRKGTISLITGTSEFFFNLEDHLEWNGSFTAWGEVVDEMSWQVLQAIVALPTHQELHPSGTVLRILNQAVNFSVSLKLGYHGQN